MRLPLLLHCKPRLVTGPTVMLQRGSWAIEAATVSNSLINFTSIGPDSLECTVPLINKEQFDFITDVRAFITIVHSGMESELIIYARFIK